MTDLGSPDRHINVNIKRNSKKKAGFEVEKRKDGYYYISKVPKSCTKIGVGDRVLEINGTTQDEFKSEKNANELVDAIRLDIAPVDGDDYQDNDSGEEQYEELDRSKSKTRNKRNAAPMAPDPMTPAPSEGDGGGGYGNESPEVGSGSFNSKDQSNTSLLEKASVKSATDETWEREYVSKYRPKERFMISVTKKDGDDDDLGVDFVEFEEGEIYVSDVNRGPFYDTALNRGDKILSINGKKIPDHIKTVDEVINILYSKSKLTLFVLRPKKSDEGYNWVHDMHEQ